MDILIKSFNRPFYLDRCIQSIYLNVKGDFNLKVLDDGTPNKYLEKIQNKYPKIKIFTSKNYKEKTEAIEENLKSGKDINGFKIPTDLWIDTVKKSSQYFFITEDDVWFTREIDLNSLEQSMQLEKIYLLKLGWLGNATYKDNCIIKALNAEIIATKPQLYTAPNFIMKALFKNKFKCFSLLYRMGWVDHNTIGKYWILNSMLMGIYHRDYWLSIWQDANGRVNEIHQLINATNFYRKNKKNENFIAHLNQEALKTTFISSATNSYHKYEVDFDVNRFNYILNESWYDDKFNSFDNYPKDFSYEVISNLLLEANHPKARFAEWKKWSDLFKAQYKQQGCEVE
ncbi:glycosyltransferase family 2 protein [Apibacter muscae]|uniref:Glycosyltransferase family 2 protein n=1 Tax=Apibacter muscae TaxID=2509004 RepID=A0A563D8U6_9FLAO|nr:glycosyltransferase family 2 protein [Apibacter muscae]TWP26698.1 glycosyltransferase family 2 protein [Apibacter muscae]TWP28272.1 glycosyltransferase family 2 protein [Apibacter muscae]